MADRQAHLFPTMIKVSFGGAGSFTPCPDRISLTSRIASYGCALDYSWIDGRPPTVDSLDLRIPDS